MRPAGPPPSPVFPSHGPQFLEPQRQECSTHPQLAEGDRGDPPWRRRGWVPHLKQFSQKRPPSGAGEGFLKLAFEFLGGKIDHRDSVLCHQVEELIPVKTEQLSRLPLG